MAKINPKNNICFLPARGGSKRIPEKNIKDFCGKPMIAHAIEAALESKMFDRVIVSTDSKEIAEISKKYGAEVPELRSDKNSDDHATLIDVLLELKKYWEAYQSISVILPTSPLLRPETLQEAFEAFEKNPKESLVPVTSFSFPIQRAFKIENGTLRMREPEHEFTRSQDLEEHYHDAGSFYILSKETFEKDHRLFSKNAVPFVLDEMLVQDIDTEEDWNIAEAKYRLMNEK